MEEFYRIRRLPPYVFEQVNRAKAVARNGGADIIDLGMGNPDLPTPAHVVEKLKETVGKVSGNKKLRAEGKADQVKGNVKQAGEKLKDAFKK